MVNRKGREALRGVEVQTLDIIFETLASDLWAEWLDALLVRAANEGYRDLAQQLVGAGAEIGDALHEAKGTRNKREALGGQEVSTFDLIFEVFTSEHLAVFLKAPLHRAAANGNRGLAQRMVRAGAQIGDALHGAVEGGHGEIVSDLLESGASLVAKDTNGRTPHHVTAEFGKTEMVQLLSLKGADKGAFTDDEWTPLSLAAYHGHMAAALALLAAGADVSLRYGRLKSPVMHAAAENGHVEIVRALIEHAAGVDAVDIHQHTALHAAARFNKIDVIHVLVVEARAKIEARDRSGYTPLHHATGSLSREATLCLLKHGAIVNAQDNVLQTPLHYAAAKAGAQGAAEVVDSLLRADAEEEIVNNDGDNAADALGVGVEEEQDRLAEDFERVRGS